MPKFEDVLVALAKETVMGRSHLWSWWCLSLTLNRKPDLLQQAPIFLGLTLKAHVNEEWLTLAKLYDKGRGNGTIAYAVKLAERNAGQFKIGTAEDMRKLLAVLKNDLAIVAKDLDKNSAIKTYRDEVIAHLNIASLAHGGSMSVFNRMVSSPQNLLATVDKFYTRTEQVLNGLSNACRGTGIPDFDGADPPGCNENSEICTLFG